MDAYVRAVLAGDYAEVVSFFTEDGVVNPPLESAIRGRAAILAWHRQFPKVTRFEVTITQIEGRSDLAYVYGKTALAFKPAEAPAPLQQTGKFVEIRRRQPDGRWLIAVDIFNSDGPPTPVTL